MRGLSRILPIGSRCEEKIYLKKHIFEKTVFIVLLHICIAVGFFACSGRRETEETYGYVPAVRQVDAQGGVVRDAFLCGDELVYKVYYDGEGMQPARDDYYTLSLTEEDAEAVRIPFRFPAGRTVLLAMNPDGSFADTFTETAIYFIARMADGRVGYCCSAGLGRYQVKAVKPGTLQSETVISDSPIGISPMKKPLRPWTGIWRRAEIWISSP